MILFTAFWTTFTALINTALAAFGAWLAVMLFGAIVVLALACVCKVAFDALADGPLARFF